MNHRALQAKKNRAQKLIKEQSFVAARELYLDICQHAGDDAAAWSMLGALSGQLGLFEAAGDACHKALAIDPKYRPAREALGKVLHAQGLQYQSQQRYADAAATFEELVTLSPTDAGAWLGLGNCRVGAGQNAQAVAAYRSALSITPDFPEALVNLGNLLQATGETAQALELYRRAQQRQPGNAVICNNIGNVCHALGRDSDAIAAYRDAIRLQPEYAAAHNNLGNVLQLLGQLDDAIDHYRLALKCQPGYALAWNNLASALQYQGKHGESQQCFRQALAANPDFPAAHSGLLLTLNYDTAITPEQLFEEHLAFGRRYRVTGKAARFEQRKNPDRRLKIGYLSPDFRDHPVAGFAQVLFDGQGEVADEIFGYADSTAPDAVTEQLRRGADHWRMVAGMSDEQLAALIAKDDIDIVVDLAGHTANNRLPLLARRIAPVQVSYLGYPNTTGLATMDYRVTDRWADPPGMSDELHSETLVRLHGGFLCYTPPDDAPPPAPPPCMASGRVTFGSFNNYAKLSEPAIALWSKILAGIPSSGIVLKNNSFADAQTRALCHQRFAQYGIDPSRVELLGRLPSRADHLELHRRIDIALDTFPYNGTATTCEALWMGVPVITLAGAVHAGRVGASVLNRLGLTGLIAGDAAAYVDIARRLAGDAPQLRMWRNTLRGRMRASPLCDAVRFRRDLHAAYRAMWQHWCET